MKNLFFAASIAALASSPSFAQSGDLYTAFDSDGDGIVTQDELTAFSPAFTPEVYAELDLDDSGDIVVEELESSPMLGTFRYTNPIAFRRDVPLVLRRYSTFTAIDLNGDGILSPGEVSNAIPGLTRDRFVSADLDGDGMIAFDELYGWRHYTRLEGSDAILLPEESSDDRAVVLDRVRYTRIDLNRDGFISMNELAKIAPTATLASYAAIDANDDGRIVYKELYQSDIIAKDIEKGLFVIPEADSMERTATTPTDFELDSYTFALLDADTDNLLTMDELGVAIPALTSEEFVTIDADDDEFVRYDEFYRSPVIVRYYNAGTFTLPTTRTISYQRSYFTGIDLNGDGVVAMDELQAVSPVLTQTVYTDVDLDNDGVLTYDELYGSTWFTQALDDDAIITPSYVYRYYAPTRG